MPRRWRGTSSRSMQQSGRIQSSARFFDSSKWTILISSRLLPTSIDRRFVIASIGVQRSASSLLHPPGARSRGGVLSADQSVDVIVRELHDAGIEFIVVGGMAAILNGAPIVTQDVDIVPRRTPENVERLLAWLLARGAYHRFDLANRRLPPTREPLLGSGHLNLMTSIGKLDVLCELELGQGYEQLLEDTNIVDVGDSRTVRVLGLERLIAAKARAGRPKDRAVLPLLAATLDERNMR